MSQTPQDFLDAPHSRGRGAHAEERAATWLEGRGYRVVDRNVRTPAGEIDLVAWDGDTLCFIEVKARSSEDHGGPLAAISWRKRRRLVRAAALFLADRGSEPPCRFDVLGMGLEPASGEWRFELVRDAFESF